MAELTFGPFTLDSSATRLLRDGVDVKLRPQALQALRVLLRHGGQTVRYEQMIAEACRVKEAVYFDKKADSAPVVTEMK